MWAAVSVRYRCARDGHGILMTVELIINVPSPNRITYSNSNVLGGLLPSPTSQGGRGKMCQRRRLSRGRSMYQRDLWG